MDAITEAINYFYRTLEDKPKQSDKHMDGFSDLLKSSLDFEKVKEKHSAVVNGLVINKRWDLTAENNNNQYAFEFKSILSSRFGRNFNSRVEEAIGVGLDAKANNKNIKLGYLFLLQNDDDKSFDHHQKVDKFCTALVDKYKIYESVLAIDITQDRYYYIHNNYTQFVKAFQKNSFKFNLLRFFNV